MKKSLRWLIALVLTPIVLFLLLVVLLYCPPVQRWAVKQATNYVSNHTGMEATIEEVTLSYPLDLELKGLRLLQPNDSVAGVKDTVADVRRLVASVELMPLLESRVEVNELTFTGLKANTVNFIGDLRIRGNVNRLHLVSHGVDLSKEAAKVNKAEVEGGWIDVALGDTVPEDPNKQPPLWTINIEQLNIAQTDFRLHLPGDTMSIRAQFGQATAKGTELLLHDNIYKVASLDWNGGALNYDQNYVKPSPKGFDAAHMAMQNVNLGIDSLLYAGPQMRMKVRAANFKEHSGLVVSDLRCWFEMDSVKLAMPTLYLQMPQSKMEGSFAMDMNAFDDKQPGQIKTSMEGYVSKQDLRPFLTALPQQMYDIVPNVALHVSGQLVGNLQTAKFKNLHLSMPGFFDLIGTGWVADIMKGVDYLRSDLSLNGKAENLNFVRKLLPKQVAQMVVLPENIGVKAKAHVRKKHYEGELMLAQGGGSVSVEGVYDGATDIYRAKLSAKAFPLQRFLPKMQLTPLTAEVEAKGHGVEVMEKTASLNLSLYVQKLGYGSYILDGIKGKLLKQGEQLSASIDSKNLMFNGYLLYKGIANAQKVKGRMRGNIERADLRALGAMKEHWIVATAVDANVDTDLKDAHKVVGDLSGFRLLMEGRKHSSVLVAGNFNIDGQLLKNSVLAHLSGQLTNANLQALGVVDKPYNVGASADLTLRTDMKNLYAVEGHVGSLKLNEVRGTELVNLIDGSFDIDAAKRGAKMDGKVNGQFNQVDFYQLGVVDKPLSSQFSIDGMFNMSGTDDMMLKGVLGNLRISDDGRSFAPGDVTLDVTSKRDTVRAAVSGGDFQLNTAFNNSVNQLSKRGELLAKSLREQWRNRRIDQAAILRLLPVGHFSLKSGKDNFFSSLLARSGYAFQQADINIQSSPVVGLNGVVSIDSLVFNDVHLDSIRGNISNVEGQINYNFAINNKSTNDYPYRGLLTGTVFEHGITSHITTRDYQGKTGLELAMQAAMVGRGIQLSFTEPQAIIGYKNYAVNDSNYIYVGRDRRLSANLRLQANDGTGLMVTTEDADTTSLQNVTLSMHHFEIGELMSLLPMAPKMSGKLDGDYHMVQTKNDLTISSDMSINNLVYENYPMGTVGTQFVYIPRSDNSNTVDAIITQDGKEVGVLSGTYKNEGRGELDATLEMNRFPLNYVNGFVPDQIVGLDGVGEGALSVKGPLNKLDINGEVYMDSTYLVSVPYGIRMRFTDNPVQIRNSKIAFENFELFASNGSPLDISGTLDFSSFDAMYLDAQLKAQNFQIINAKKNPRSEAYGKAFVDFVGRMSGPLSQLQLLGKLDVLGNTDMTYVVKDGTLATDTELKDLVQFTNFNDSTQEVVKRPDITGFTMGLFVNVDEQAHVLCALNADQSNYIDFMGGGQLRLNYDPTNGIQVRGRYTLSEGKMKYSLPVIPLRTFDIQNGSYVEFTGDPMQPTLNIVATEDVRTSVSNNGSDSRVVEFKCGVSLTKQFPKPGVEFIISAPEDQEMQNTLNTKSAEERSKLAVTMLASGMYFDGENSASANTAMTGALAGFLQTQVNAITGKALSSIGLDLTANMESSADVNGNLHTDYTFRFAKRLWNNRLRIIMGGRVSTGSQFAEENGTYFDNLSLEYRLNKKETKYLTLYYEREAYDWLEGNLSEYGAGFMWRRKLRNFKDIFKFKDESATPVAQPQKPVKDSLVNFVNEKK